jgi:DNA-binding NarL/FixJ family response regulator
MSGAAVLAFPAPPAAVAARQAERVASLGELERVQRGFGASRVGLVRFDLAAGTFEVVAASGRPFLAPGVRLPIAASTLLAAAAEGRRALRSTETSARPLDRIASFLGFHSGLGLPLTVAGQPIGALTVMWDVDPSPVENARTVVAGNELELVRMLVAPDPTEPRVLICHEDRLLAEGLAHLVEQRLGATTDIACTLAGALAALDNRSPELIVLSDQLCPGERLPHIARELRAAGAGAPLLALARSESKHSYERALQAGASGYLPAAYAAERFPETVATLLEGGTELEQPRTAPTTPRLTEREHQVLVGFERGWCDKEIAKELGVALSTVKTHARAIYSKLDATSRTAAVHKARLTGVI